MKSEGNQNEGNPCQNSGKMKEKMGKAKRLILDDYLGRSVALADWHAKHNVHELLSLGKKIRMLELYTKHPYYRGIERSCKFKKEKKQGKNQKTNS